MIDDGTLRVFSLLRKSCLSHYTLKREKERERERDGCLIRRKSKQTMAIDAVDPFSHNKNNTYCMYRIQSDHPDLSHFFEHTTSKECKNERNSKKNYTTQKEPSNSLFN